jgi:hypothetical protein
MLVVSCWLLVAVCLRPSTAQMDPARPSDLLRVGAIIEVQWVLEGRGKPREVWWRAAVRQTCFRGRAKGVLGTATIDYEESFGFAQSSDKVLLFDDNLLASNTSGASVHPKHKWRLCSEGMTDSADAADDASDAGAPLRTSAAAPSFKRHEILQMADPGPEPSSVHELVRRVTIIERAFCGPYRGILVPHANGSGFGGIEGATRALRFSSLKIGEILERPVSVQRSSSRRRETRLNTVHADSVQTEADCTLLEFASISKLVNELYPGGVQFSPSYSYTQDPAMTCTRLEILFESFYALAAVLGVSRSGAALSILRERVDKRNEAGCTVRVLGALAIREAETTAAAATCTTSKPSTVLAVGHSAVRHIDSGEMIPIVCRQSNVWDAVDQAYVNSLEARHVLSTELPLLFATDTENESDVEESNEPIHRAFSLTWIRTSKQANAGSFVECRCDEVLGVLQATLPCALFRGKSACEEATNIITEDFICSRDQ